MSEPTKWCNKGQHDVPLSGFSKGGKRYGLQSWCKECRKPIDKIHGERKTKRRRLAREARLAALDTGKRLNDSGEIEQTKPCSKCKRVLFLSQYTAQPRGKYGRQAECRACVSARAKDKRVNNPEHRARALAYTREFEKSEHGKQWRREYNKAHSEMRRRIQSNWRSKNVEKSHQYNREFRTRYPEKIREWDRLRKALARSSVGTFTTMQWFAKCEYWGWRCYLCRAALTPESVTLDHRKAIASGGSNWISNIAPCCFSCNSTKNDLPESQFRALLTKTPTTLPLFPTESR